MKKYKCSMCGYFLPKAMFYNPYSKGYYNICNNCVHNAIHIYMNEIRKYNIHIFTYIPDGINISFDYLYDCHLTFDANISIIVYNIDRLVIDYYKRGD